MPDCGDHVLGAISMIAVDQNRHRSLAFDRIGNRLVLSKESWLQSTELDHQTQQRSDNFFARENQHVGHGVPAKGDFCRAATYGPEPTLAYGRYRRYSLGTNVHLARGKSLVSGDNSYFPYAVELTFRKCDEGVAVGARGAITEARSARAGAERAPQAGRARGAGKERSSRGAAGQLQAGVELARGVDATTICRSNRADSPESGDTLYQGVLRRVEETGYFADVRGTSLALST